MMNLKPSHLVIIVTLAYVLVACHGTPTKQADDGAPHTVLNPSHINDAQPKAEAYSKYGNPQTYKVFGKKYEVWDSHIGYEEQGLASWYGTKFHGRRTSSGEPYDMYAMTAAHKNLPIPSYARVTNLDTGKSIIVRVNDRGPFHKDRILDLSYAAATKLDILRTGTGKVKIESLDLRDKEGVQLASATPPINDNAGGIYLQIAAFTEIEKANALAAQLMPHSAHPVEVRESSSLYRVHVGPFPSHNEASKFKQVLASLGFPSPFITRR